MTISVKRSGRGLYTMPLNVYLMAALVVGAAIAHVTWLPLAPLGIRPDLMLVLVVTWSLMRGPREGLIWAFFGGALLDLLSAGPFGAFTLALLVVAMLVGLVHSTVFGTGLLLPTLAIAGATFLYHVLYVAVLAAASHTAFWGTASATLGAVILWNVGLLWLLARPLAWLHQHTGATRMQW